MLRSQYRRSVCLYVYTLFCVCLHRMCRSDWRRKAHKKRWGGCELWILTVYMFLHGCYIMSVSENVPCRTRSADVRNVWRRSRNGQIEPWEWGHGNKTGRSTVSYQRRWEGGTKEVKDFVQDFHGFGHHSDQLWLFYWSSESWDLGLQGLY